MSTAWIISAYQDEGGTISVTPDEYANTFGLGAEGLVALRAFCTAHGLSYHWVGRTLMLSDERVSDAA
jgi:hypothetical protein